MSEMAKLDFSFASTLHLQDFTRCEVLNVSVCLPRLRHYDVHLHTFQQPYDLQLLQKLAKLNNFLIEFQKPVSPKDFSNKLELSKELNKILEKMILKNPGQWIWSHNRWK